MRTNKDKMISIRLTKEAMRLLDLAMVQNGVTRTTAIELAVRKHWGMLEKLEKEDASKP
jgi:hypothetical protein